MNSYCSKGLLAGLVNVISYRDLKQIFKVTFLSNSAFAGFIAGQIGPVWDEMIRSTSALVGKSSARVITQNILETGTKGQPQFKSLKFSTGGAIWTYENSRDILGAIKSQRMTLGGKIQRYFCHAPKVALRCCFRKG